MRLRLACVLLGCSVLAATAAADEPAILSLEVRGAGGVRFLDKSIATLDVSPSGVSIGGEGAFMAVPWTSVYGFIFLDTIATVNTGFAAGFRFHPSESHLRFGLGASAVLTPAVEAGPQAMLGLCFRPGSTHFCLDVEGTAYVVGDELRTGEVDAQVRLALEIGVDVL